MKHCMPSFLLTLALTMVLAQPLYAQQRKTGTKTTKTATKTTKKSTTTKKKTTKPATQNKTYTTPTIKGLQNQRSKIQGEIKRQEKALQANRADVKKRLQNLMVLNSAITERQKSIDDIQQDINSIDGDIDLLNTQLITLQTQLAERKAKYLKSIRYMARNHNVQDKMMFIFSAKNLTQMFRRLRFVRQYASFQRAQGEAVMAKQRQVNEKQQQLEAARNEKHTLLQKDQKERTALQGQQDEQQKMVSTLQKQQKAIQGIIDEQKKKDAALNAQIDRLVAEEVAKAAARAAAEAKRKAAAEAEAKRKAEELARKKAAAEAAARENARRIAEAKAREEKAKAAAREAKEADRARAEQAAKQAEAERKAAELKARTDEERSKKELASVKKEVEESGMMTSVDRKLSGGFESNKGRLPVPVTGSYKLVSHFGQYNVDGLRNVTLDNKGINILGTPDCQARSIYDGEVSAVFQYAGTHVVMVRHGGYISVYCNLRSVSVSRGQHVTTRQTLGTVGTDNILQFQLRRGTAKLNPEQWIAR